MMLKVLFLIVGFVSASVLAKTPTLKDYVGNYQCHSLSHTQPKFIYVNKAVIQVELLSGDRMKFSWTAEGQAQTYTTKGAFKHSGNGWYSQQGPEYTNIHFKTAFKDRMLDMGIGDSGKSIQSKRCTKKVN